MRSEALRRQSRLRAQGKRYLSRFVPPSALRGNQDVPTPSRNQMEQSSNVPILAPLVRVRHLLAPVIHWHLCGPWDRQYSKPNIADCRDYDINGQALQVRATSPANRPVVKAPTVFSRHCVAPSRGSRSGPLGASSHQPEGFHHFFVRSQRRRIGGNQC